MEEHQQFQKPDEVSGDVFCLWIDHGGKPTAKSYQYVVVPGIAVDEMDRYVEQSQIEVVGNTPEMQAVRHQGLGITQIAFYRPGRVATAPMSIASDKPCLLIVREMGDTVRMAVSNPENRPLELTLNSAANSVAKAANGTRSKASPASTSACPTAIWPAAASCAS